MGIRKIKLTRTYPR